MSAEHLTPRPEIIRVGQAFQPFNPSRVLLDKVGECHVRFLLETGALPIFTVEIYIQDFGEGYLKSGAFTPFHPGAGYTLTDEDFSPQKRRRKIEMMEVQGIPAIDYRIASKELNGQIEPDELEKQGFLTSNRENLRPEVEATLRRLGLQFSFPNGVYETRTDSTYFDPDTLAVSHWLEKEGHYDPLPVNFDSFYPIARGPLAAYADDDSTGLKILVHPQMEELSQIRGKFVLAQ